MIRDIDHRFWLEIGSDASTVTGLFPHGPALRGDRSLLAAVGLEDEIELRCTEWRFECEAFRRLHHGHHGDGTSRIKESLTANTVSESRYGSVPSKMCVVTRS